MTPRFSVRSTAHFDLEFRKLVRQHRTIVDAFERVLTVLHVDPFNSTRAHPIKKLEGVPPGEGRYRIRVGRFRFRYDIGGDVV